MFGKPVVGTLGNLGMPGAPILKFWLNDWVGPVTPGPVQFGTVNGRVEITQAVSPPLSLHAPVTGRSFQHGDVMIIEISGIAGVPFKPPAIGSLDEPVGATIALEGNLGAGSFFYGNHAVKHVPAHSEKL